MLSQVVKVVAGGGWPEHLFDVVAHSSIPMTKKSRSRFFIPLCAVMLPMLLAASALGQASTIVGWDFANGSYPGGTGNFGPSPAAANTIASNVTSTGLTRGGFLTTGTGAANAWGGTGGNGSASFTVKANTGFALSLTQISAYNVRRSSSGSQTGQWAYSLDGTTFVNIGTEIAWGSSTSGTGNLQGAIDLSGIPALQGLPATTTVTFRVTTGGATGTGTWYLNNFQTGDDFVVTGTVTPTGGVTVVTLDVDPPAVDEGDTANATVTLSTAAGPGGVTVNLASSDPLRATVPASVVVAQGQTSAEFVVTTLDDGVFGDDEVVTITADAGEGFTLANATITVRNTTPEPVLAISLAARDDPVGQDFDGLGTSTVNSIFSGTTGVQTSLGRVPDLEAVSGWYVTQSGGTGTTLSGLTANNGSSSTGGAFNYGSTEAPANLDRSLGALASVGRIMTVGALITNDGDEVMDNIVISFTAKIWRSGANVNTMTFGYGKLGEEAALGNFLTSPSALAFSALNIVTPAAGSSAALDGNLPANQIPFVEVPIPGVNLAPGETMFIRWADDDAGGTDSGVGIDDFVVYGTGAAALAAPEFDLAAGTYLVDQTVRVSNFSSYAAGTEVRFTTDGTQPGPGSQLYDDTTGIALVDGNGTVNLRAVAIDPETEETSLVTSVTYQFPLNVANLTALRASPTGSTIYRVTGEVTFTAGTSNRNTKFFQDNAAGIQIDDTAGTITTVYTAGDNVAGIIGRISTFNGQLQMVPLQDFGAPVSSGNAVTPIPRSITTLDNDVQSMLVVLQDVTFQNAGQAFGGGGSTTPIADASTEGVFRNAFRNIFGESNVTGATIPSGPNTLTGIVQRTSTTVIAVGPRSLSDIVFDGTPSLSIQTNKLDLVAGATGETAEATVEIRRVGATDAELVVDLTQDVEGAFAADVDSSFEYVSLPTTVTIPAGSSAVLIYVVALDRSVSVSAALTASAEGFDSATQLFAITGSGGGGQTFDDWAGGAPLNQANVLKYAIGGASSPTATDGVAPVTGLTATDLSLMAIVRTNDPSLTTVGTALTDLLGGTWSTDGVTMTPDVNQDDVPEGCERQIFSTPRGVDGKKFLRLQSTLSQP